MLDDHAQLVIDEELYLQATKTLSDLEDADEKFEMLNVIGRFTEELYLAARFSVDVDEELGADERGAIEQYVAAVALVSHTHAELGDIGEIREEFAGETLEFIRSAAWAFITAWTHRYGGFYANRVVSGTGTLIDPGSSRPQTP